MTDQTEQSNASNRHFCAHCGTENDKGVYACNRCGERLIEVTNESNPSLGLNSCARCGGTNNIRGVYCWVCGSEMKDAVRIDPKAKPELQVPSAASPRTYRPDLNPVSTPSANPNIVGQDQQPDLPGAASEAEHNNHAAPMNPFGSPDGESNENTSGIRGGEIPAGVKRWNWAAFLMTPVWGLFSGVPYTVLLFGAPLLDRIFPPWVQAVVVVVASIYLGAKGNEHAWRGKKWRSVEHFKAFQKQWTSWAFKLSVAAIALAVLYVMFTDGP